jgi:hypothetical protein
MDTRSALTAFLCVVILGLVCALVYLRWWKPEAERVPVYTISLPRRTENRVAFQLANAPAYKVRFIDAVDGKDLDMSTSKQTTAGRHGCFLSHLKVWEKVVRDHAPGEWVVITEDDYQLPRSFDLPLYQRAAEKLGVGMVMLDYSNPVWQKADRPGVKLINGDLYGLFFYMITPEGARRLLDNIADPAEGVPADVAVSDLGPFAVAVGPERPTRPLTAAGNSDSEAFPVERESKL